MKKQKSKPWGIFISLKILEILTVVFGPWLVGIFIKQIPTLYSNMCEFTVDSSVSNNWLCSSGFIQHWIMGLGFLCLILLAGVAIFCLYKIILLILEVFICVNWDFAERIQEGFE